MFDKTSKVSLVMTTDVATVQSNDTMDKAAEFFKTKGFHHLPVVDYGKLVGIISSTDFHMLEDNFTLFKNRQAEAMNKAIMRSLLIKDVMTKQVVSLSPEDSLEYAADIFRENLFRAMPVIDKEKKLLGILTPYDLLNYAYGNVPAALV